MWSATASTTAPAASASFPATTRGTWFWLPRQGWEMLYVPDVVAYGFEELPDRHRFFASSIGLMRRWYGNMLRNNGRAIALGPRKMGLVHLVVAGRPAHLDVDLAHGVRSPLSC
ncbi:MAG: hypothetical protein R3D03_13490 [Geminicoccaceae bacterium]